MNGRRSTFKMAIVEFLSLFLFCIGVSEAVMAPPPVKTMNDGNTIPVLGLGTYGISFQPSDLPKIRQTIITAVELGYRHIDTATIYHNEAEVGQAIADVIAKGLVKREELFITTKVWSDRAKREEVVQNLRESLQRLGLDYVDLYLIHTPSETVDYLETWKGMEDAKKLGLTKSIGVSNFDENQIDRLVANSEIKPAANQIEVNPTRTQELFVEKLQQLGITVIAYTPLGFVVSRRTPTSLPPGPDDPTLVGFAKKYNKTVPQIVLRYLIDRGTIPIPKSTNKDRLRENIDLFDFHLTPQEVAQINKFNQNKSVLDE